MTFSFAFGLSKYVFAQTKIYLRRTIFSFVLPELLPWSFWPTYPPHAPPTRLCHVQIQINGRQLNLGKFTTPMEAAKKYDDEARKAFGERAKLNFPREVPCCCCCFCCWNTHLGLLLEWLPGAALCLSRGASWLTGVQTIDSFSSVGIGRGS